MIDKLLNMNARGFKFISVYWIILAASYLMVYEQYDIEYFFDKHSWVDTWSLVLFPVAFVYIGRLFYKFYKSGV